MNASDATPFGEPSGVPRVEQTQNEVNAHSLGRCLWGEGFLPGLFLLLNEIEELEVMTVSGQHRSVAIGVRLRPHEKDEIEEAARRRGKWPSELAREAALRSARRVLRDTDIEPTRN